MSLALKGEKPHERTCATQHTWSSERLTDLRVLRYGCRVLHGVSREQFAASVTENVFWKSTSSLCEVLGFYKWLSGFGNGLRACRGSLHNHRLPTQYGGVRCPNLYLMSERPRQHTQQSPSEAATQARMLSNPGLSGENAKNPETYPCEHRLGTIFEGSDLLVDSLPPKLLRHTPRQPLSTLPATTTTSASQLPAEIESMTSVQIYIARACIEFLTHVASSVISFNEGNVSALGWTCFALPLSAESLPGRHLPIDRQRICLPAIGCFDAPEHTRCNGPDYGAPLDTSGTHARRCPSGT